jgi:hypothetical protein
VVFGELLRGIKKSRLLKAGWKPALQEREVMAGATGVHEAAGALFERVKKRESLTGEDGQGAQRALLQVVMGPQGLAQDALVVVEEFLAAVGGTTGAGAEFVELVEHLPF